MWQDFGYAVRTLRKTPGFTAVAVLSLALGIGANSAIFSLANGLIFRPLHVPNPSQVIAIQSQMRGEALGGILQNSPVSYPDFADLRSRSQSFSGLVASEYLPLGFTVDKNALPRMRYGAAVSGDFFRVLGVPPAAGRDFRADEDRVPGRDAVVMLGYDLWKTEFSGSPDAIGKTIFVNGLAFTVIGVAPAGFTGPHPLILASLYVPLAMIPRLAGESAPNPLESRADRSLFVHGRLRPGVSLKQAAAEAGIISRQLAQSYPDTNRTCTLVADTEPSARMHQNPLNLALVVALMALSAVVLLIACANVMNLMLSRGRARSREIAVRLAIGASRSRLIRQFLTESLIIAFAGGLLGLLVAQAGADLFSKIRIPSDIPAVLDFNPDPRVLFFTALIAVASAILFGLAPAFRSSRPDLSAALKPGIMAGGKRRQLFGRNALVIAQVAGSLLLLVLATQAYRGVEFLLTAPAGFRTDHLLTATFNPSLARYTPAQTADFYRRLLDRARTLSGVKAAAFTEGVPLLPDGSVDRVIPEGYRLPPGTEAVSVISDAVSEDYFTAIGIPIVEGRSFAATDRADAPRVAIVNQLFASRYYPNQSAVGRRFRLEGASETVVEIVGIARQSKYLFPVEPPVDFLYLPLAQNPRTSMTLLLQTAGAPGELTGPLRDLVHSLDPGQPVIGIRTMEEIFDQRARGTLGVLIQAIAGMGVLGLVLALVGLYGLMTYSVGLRQREIGIRMAIGAGRAGVMTMVLKQGLVLAGIGVAIGLSILLTLGKPLMRLVEARSFDWGLLTLTVAGLLGAAAIGAYLPARRASLVDPNSVLRQG
jgi:macrolide transport system ATP-binding/permease protein